MSTIPRQSAGRWDADHVVRHDLRPPDAVRTFVDHHLWDQPGTRALVIVRGADLDDMRETLFDIAAARRMAVVCLVIGEPPDGITHPALVLPGVLGSSGVGTLWVSDAEGRGCGWWIDSAQPMPSSESLLRQADRSALDLLDDCLQVPDVFDGVLRELEQMADHVASPGLLAFGGRLAASALLAARLRAARTVSQGGPAAVQREPLLETIMPSAAPGGPNLDALLTPGMEPARMRRAAREAAEDAAALSEGLSLRLLLSGRSAGHPGIVAGHARAVIQQFHRTIGRLLNSGHHPGEDLDEPARERILAHGVALEALPPVPTSLLLSELRAQTERRLRTSSIEATQLWLRLLADAATPRGSGDYLRALAAIDAAAQPLPEFPLRAAPAWLLGLLGLAAGVGALAGPPGAAVAVVALLGVLLMLARRPTPDATAGIGAAMGTLLRAYLPVVGVGLIAGTAVARTVAIPSSVTTGVAVAAGFAVVVAVFSWWNAAARAWPALIDAEAPLRTLRDLDVLLHRVIVEEWHRAPARAYLADTAVAVAVALERVAAVLKEQSAALSGGPSPEGFDEVPDPGLDELLTTDLRDAVEASLFGVWTQARTGAPTGAWDAAGERMREHLEEYDRHLALHDVHDPPPFARAGRTRSRAHGSWIPPQHLADLLETAADGPLVQLCRTRHTNLLSLNRIRAVRFAPASVQADVAAELAQRGRSPLLSDLCWTHSGSLAGLVRLVAPRTGVVEMAWHREEGPLGWTTEEVPDA
ncbi:hypothetical protein AB0M36_23255 [Actinoplanes sp. NPDC051346]|uniref:hypothetical protein n=1 Tax=Actinoplanes sp. NPDC051346 TaxID=3155048 RepID=UPI003440651D